MTRPHWICRGCPHCHGDLELQHDVADGTRGYRYHCLLCGREFIREDHDPSQPPGVATPPYLRATVIPVPRRLRGVEAYE